MAIFRHRIRVGVTTSRLLCLLDLVVQCDVSEVNGCSRCDAITSVVGVLSGS